MKKKLLCLAMVAAMLASLTACGSGSTSTGSSETTAAETGSAAESEAAETTQAAEEAEDEESESAGSDEVISLTVWGAEEDQDLLQTLVAGFEAEYSDYTFDITIGVESESTAKDTILTDIEAAADVFAFADDQIVSLVNAGALYALNDDMDAVLQAYAGKSLDDVTSANSEGSVGAATVNDTLYAFPMGSGNNFFLYYDSTRVSAEDVTSWDSLLAAADAAGSKVGMTLASGWYNAGFYLGAGFSVELNADGTTSIDWNGTSSSGYTGVEVTEAILNITGNSAFLAIADGDITNQIASGSVCAVVSGTWDAEAAQTAFGDGYAATCLPTFTVGDDQVQQGAFSGYKLIGVNAYTEQPGWAVLLAEYLTNEESQTARFEARQLCPTNLVAASADEVNENAAIAASNAQDQVGGFAQRTGDKFWDPTATFGEILAQGTLTVGDTDGI